MESIDHCSSSVGIALSSLELRLHSLDLELESFFLGFVFLLILFGTALKDLGLIPFLDDLTCNLYYG